MKTYRIELTADEKVIYRNYISAYLVETAIIAAAAVAMKYGKRCTAIVTDGKISYSNDY